MCWGVACGRGGCTLTTAKGRCHDGVRGIEALYKPSQMDDGGNSGFEHGDPAGLIALASQLLMINDTTIRRWFDAAMTPFADLPADMHERVEAQLWAAYRMGFREAMGLWTGQTDGGLTQATTRAEEGGERLLQKINPLLLTIEADPSVVVRADNNLGHDAS